MNWISRFSIFSLLAVLAACSHQQSQDTIQPNAESSADRTFVENQDADVFLEGWSTDNTQVYHVIGEPNDMHPTNGISGNRTFVHTLTQGYLMRGDIVSLEGINPSLVEGQPQVSEDQLRFTYSLRQEPTWDDGSPITVEDVIFTMKAVKCPLTANPHHKPYIENLISIETYSSNHRQFAMVMKEKYMHNVGILSEFPLMQEAFWDEDLVLRNYTLEDFDSPDFDVDDKVLNEWATEFNDPKYGRQPELLVGLGPYRFSDWKVGQSFTLSRKENHWTSKLADPSVYETAYPDKIIFKLNTDENSQILEFKTQVLDGSNALSSSALLQLSESPSFKENYHSATTPSFNYTYLGFNMKPDGIEHKKLFDDVRVRRAIAHLVQYEQINQVLYNGSRTRMAGPVSPLKKSFNSNLELVEYNLAKAKEILNEAGWIDSDNDNILDKSIDGETVSFEFDLHYMSNSSSWKDMALMISESLYDAGIKCNPRPVEFTVLSQKSRDHDFDAILKAWAGSSAPEDFTQVWHSESWAKKGSNYVGFGSPESDALIDSIKYSVAEEERKPLEDRLQQLIVEEQPYVFLFASSRTNVIHRRFGNADMYYEKPGVLLNNLKLLKPGLDPIAED